MDHEEAAILLGLDAHRHLNKSDVDHAYRTASLATHPDRGGSNEEFQRVSTAKEVLYNEIETGRRIKKSDVGQGDTVISPTAKQTGGHGWAGEKYDTPSTQSPLSPLRQMGQPVDLNSLTSSKVVDLWEKRQLQCVWRCESCDAVCCRVRREKFRCVCGHQLRDHDPSQGFKCTCQAKKKAHEGAVHKGGCKCKKFEFLVSFGMWTTKCICKHGHDAHDPATLLCRKCEAHSAELCPGWHPTFQCHCGHSCQEHKTAFVYGTLAKGHRDWVVSGVRLETARIAEKFRERPLAEQIKLRASMGMSEGMFFNVFTSTQEEISRQRKAKQSDPTNNGVGAREDRRNGEPHTGTKKKTSEEEEGPIYQKDNVFIRNQVDVENRSLRKELLKERLRCEAELKTTFTPRTNHKSSVKKIKKKSMLHRSTSLNDVNISQISDASMLGHDTQVHFSSLRKSKSAQFESPPLVSSPPAEVLTPSMESELASGERVRHAKVRVPKPKQIKGHNKAIKQSSSSTYLDLIASLNVRHRAKRGPAETAASETPTLEGEKSVVDEGGWNNRINGCREELQQPQEQMEEELIQEQGPQQPQEQMEEELIQELGPQQPQEQPFSEVEELRVHEAVCGSLCSGSQIRLLTGWLESHGLSSISESLIQIGGAESLQDLLLLDDDDLNELGVDPQMKQLFWEAMQTMTSISTTFHI